MFQAPAVSAAEKTDTRILNGEGAASADDFVRAVRSALGEMSDEYEEAVSRFSRRHPVVSRRILDENKMDIVRDALLVAGRGRHVVSHMLFGLGIMMMCRDAGLIANNPAKLPVPRSPHEEHQEVMQFPFSMVAAMGVMSMVGPVAVPGIPPIPLRCC